MGSAIGEAAVVSEMVAAGVHVYVHVDGSGNPEEPVTLSTTESPSHITVLEAFTVIESDILTNTVIVSIYLQVPLESPVTMNVVVEAVSYTHLRAHET